MANYDPKPNASEERAKRKLEAQKGKKKKHYKIRKVSNKKAKINSQYSKTIAKKFEEMEFAYCQGCGRSDLKCNNSHSIPESWNEDLKNDIDNISYHCQEPATGKIYSCHSIVELGFWDMLDNGEQIKEYILKTDPEYYARKYKEGKIKNSK